MIMVIYLLRRCVWGVWQLLIPLMVGARHGVPYVEHGELLGFIADVLVLRRGSL